MSSKFTSSRLTTAARLFDLPLILRRRRRFAGVGLLMTAFLGLLGGPCAMALAASNPEHPAAEQQAENHGDCPNAGEHRSMTADSCCCLTKIAGGGDATPKPGAPVAVAMLLALPDLALHQGVGPIGAPLRSCLHQTSPPVYLATQRLRL
ncbi:MAG: hypothetical protein ACNA7W_15025 [Pseudomonadales bacterium]